MNGMKRVLRELEMEYGFFIFEEGARLPKVGCHRIHNDRPNA